MDFPNRVAAARFRHYGMTESRGSARLKEDLYARRQTTRDVILARVR